MGCIETGIFKLKGSVAFRLTLTWDVLKRGKPYLCNTALDRLTLTWDVLKHATGCRIEILNRGINFNMGCIETHII